MRVPTTILEGKKIPRIIFSIQPFPVRNPDKIFDLTKKSYEMGVECFDLPSTNHLRCLKNLRDLMSDESLIGICHLDANEGASFLGKPLHRFESRIISTIRREVLPSQNREFLPSSSSSEVFTQKEVDRIAFDASRFEKALSRFDPNNSPFLLIGEKYGDWLLALGRIDLLREMVSQVREKGFLPIFAGQWTTFTLPKAKSLNVSAFAFPINKKRSFFDLERASALVKKFDKPVISLNPLDNGSLLEEPERALSFLFDELKVYAAIARIGSEEETKKIIGAVSKFSSFIPPRKT